MKILIVFILVAITSSQAWNVTTLPNGVLAYTEARTWILHHEWTVIITIRSPDNTPIQGWIDQSLATLDRLVELRRLPESHVPALRNRFLLLKTQYNTSKVKVESARHKRALIDLVGHISRKLFGTATESQVGELMNIMEQAKIRQEVLFQNQEKLATVVNKTRQQALINHEDIQRIFNDITKLHNVLRDSVKKADRMNAYFGMMDTASQLEIIHQLTSQRHRTYIAAVEAIRNGHLTEDLLNDIQLQEIIRLMSRIGWMLPIPWTRTFSPVTAVSEVGNELVATCTLWAASHEEYAKWHILAMWITTRAAHAFTKLEVHNVVVDKTFTEQFEPIECRGKFEQICKVTSTTGRKCEITILGGTPLKCKYALSNKVNSLSITRIIDGSWLIDTAKCVRITIQCPKEPFEDHTVCAPSVLKTEDKCVLVWQEGRTYPVHSHLLRYNTPIHVPLRWIPFKLPSNYDNYTLQLHAIHERPVLTHDDDLVLKPLPPMSKIPHQRYYTTPIVVIVVVIISIVCTLCCAWKHKLTLARKVIKEVEERWMNKPPDTTTAIEKEDVESGGSKVAEALPWPRKM